LLAEEVTRNAHRASRAAEVLWQLEGQRLQKKAVRYRRDWEKFVAAWSELKVKPRPFYLEKSFGMDPAEGEERSEPLVLRDNGQVVRLGGRIDRVDLAETENDVFFWIVDYKTGRSLHYTGSSLKSFERLQLTLYALAVARVLQKERAARPLGLAYWLVTDTGPKIVLPEDRKHQGWFKKSEEWRRLGQLLEGLVVDLVKHIRAGDFALAPRQQNCTETCPFAQVCRITQGRSVAKAWEVQLPVL
jgi:ATP-dependent helicase/DNAse subunit B